MKNKNSLIGLLLLSCVLIWSSCVNETVSTDEPITTKKEEPKFVKEGILTFQLGDTLKKIIDIEIVDKEQEIMQGLMYRTKMDERQGMLFVFPNSQERSFWMKNTVISLDIIYVSSDKKVVSVQKYATPFSEESLPSYGDAMYVLEVVGGFCDKYGVRSGTQLSFDI